MAGEKTREDLGDVYEVQPLPKRAVTAPVAILVPGSKSITNRALLLAALADGSSKLTGALFSDDTKYMAACLREMGIVIEERSDDRSFTVRGTGGRLKTPTKPLFIGNAGTAARFLTAAVCLGHGRFVIDGTPRMRQRPIGDLVEALRQLGAKIECPTGCPPVTVDADGLRGGAATVAGNISSQYLSALLMVAPYAAKDVTLSVKGELIARPYVRMTVEVMKQFGVRDIEDHVSFGGARPRYGVRAGQRYQSGEYRVEPDASSAHYFLAAAALTGRCVRIDGIGGSSIQGDAKFAVDVLKKMGAHVNVEPGATTVWREEDLRGIDEVDLNDMSDTAPTVAVLAAFASSPTRIRGIGHLRHQESDRIKAVSTELTKLGGRIEEKEDGWDIFPSSLHRGEIETYDDHRIAMAFALAGLELEKGISIRDPACVNKTFPDFFERLEELRQ